MTTNDSTGLASPTAGWAATGLQVFLLVLFGFGLVTLQFSLVVTAGVTLGVTFLPALLEWEYGYSLDPRLVLLLTTAVTIHALGSMGLYAQFTWFDNVAHTVSATVVAGVGYAAFRALEIHSEDVDVPPEFRSVFIVVFVLAVGVFWEVLEFALGDILTVYGVQDIVTDMVFNFCGASIVALWGSSYFDGVVAFFLRRFRTGG